LYGAGIDGIFFFKNYSSPDPHTSVPVPVLADRLFLGICFVFISARLLIGRTALNFAAIM
jgi:hypothetical protein